MTITEFGRLPLDKKAEYAWRIPVLPLVCDPNGRYLLQREGRWTKRNLYAVGALYVEIWIDRGRNSITHITAFADAKKLDAYLGRVSLKGLL